MKNSKRSQMNGFSMLPQYYCEKTYSAWILLTSFTKKESRFLCWFYNYFELKLEGSKTQFYYRADKMSTQKGKKKKKKNPFEIALFSLFVLGMKCHKPVTPTVNFVISPFTKINNAVHDHICAYSKTRLNLLARKLCFF